MKSQSPSISVPKMEESPKTYLSCIYIYIRIRLMEVGKFPTFPTSPCKKKLSIPAFFLVPETFSEIS